MSLKALMISVLEGIGVKNTTDADILDVHTEKYGETSPKIKKREIE